MTTVNIKDIRHKLGLSQEALAHLIGVTFQTVNRWECGKATPSPLSLQKIKAIANKASK